MIRLIPGADIAVRKLSCEDSVREFHRNVCESYAREDTNTFINNMQILLTKIGIMIANVELGGENDISYCSQSIRYLCGAVLDDRSLARTFYDIGLNDKGNEGKHKIAKNVSIDMLRCVSAYNTLIVKIVKRYGLISLENMIVRKQEAKPLPTDKYGSVATASPVPQKSTRAQYKANIPPESQVASDEYLKVSVALEKGSGHYTKGVFNKKSLVNFKLNISIANGRGVRISNALAVVKGRGDHMEKRLSRAAKSSTEFDLPANIYGGNVEITVIIGYRIAIFKNKQIRITVSKNFSR